MGDSDDERTDEGDEEQNQYGGGDQEVDATEQTERMTDDEDEDDADG